MTNKLEANEGSVINEASELDKLLADEYLLYMRTRAGSRNMSEISPSEVHELLRSQCESMSSIVAGVSRRVRMFGPAPSFVLEEFMAKTRLTGRGEPFPKQNEIIAALVDDHESVLYVLRNDKFREVDHGTAMSTADFTADLLNQHEEMAGALRGWLE